MPAVTPHLAAAVPSLPADCDASWLPHVLADSADPKVGD